MYCHETLIIFCVVFFFLLILHLFFGFVSNATLEARLARCPKVEIAPNKAESDIIRRESFLKPGTVSDFWLKADCFGAVIWRAAPCTNEGKRVSVSQDTRRGLTSAISSHFRDFRTFSVHLPGLAKSSHHRLLLTRPEHVLVEKKSGARASLLLLLLFGKIIHSCEDVEVVTGPCFAVRNVTVNCDGRCTICGLKAVFIKVMSLRRPGN